MRARKLALIMALTGLAALPLTALPASAATPADVFISEYIEGSSNNKAIEIYNGTGAPVNLATGSYALRYYFNGGTTATLTIALTGTVASGDVYVVAQSAANATILAQADLTNGSGWFNGDDAVELIKGTTVIDVVGQIGVDPGTEWGTGLASTADNTLVRKPAFCADANGADAFDPATQWDGFATDTFTSLGAHSTPTCDGSGTGGGGGGGGTGDPCTSPFTAPSAIQGSGLTAAITGAVTTGGVVVGDYEIPAGSTQLRGFYLQDPTGDANPATSDAVFVFTATGDRVSVGQIVRVTGTAGEFQGQTQVSATTITVCPGTGIVTPTPIALPMASASAFEPFEGMLVSFAQDLTVTEHFQIGRFGEVLLSSGGRLAQPTNVVAPGAAAVALQAQNDLNQILVDDGTNLQNPDPIVFGRSGNPLSASNTLRGGDTVTGLTGVLGFTWGGNAASPNAFRVRPVGALVGTANFVAVNERPTSAPTKVGRVRVSSMNLLNFFNTFDGLPDTADNCTLGVGGPATDCRGADTAAEFARQWPKTVDAVIGSQADVVGIVEVENDGYGPDSALAFLVARLNDVAGAGTYVYIDADTGTGRVNSLGTDAIKVGFVYKPSVVRAVGTTAALDTVAFVTGGDGAPRNRPALAQAFEENATGARFVTVVNHLKSKGSACDAPDALDGQANCAAVRTAAASLLVNWLATDPTGTGDADTLIVGDLNSYAKENPIQTIEAAGYTNLVNAFVGPDAYSFVFDGQWGYLDHALANAALAGQVAGVAEWHINADEPSVLDYNTNFKSAAQLVSLYAPDRFRVSDHDGVLVDLNPTVPFAFGGFRPPVAPSPAVNVMNAGRSIPIKFSLGGNKGLAVVASATWVVVDCATGTALSSEAAALSGGSSLSYDAAEDQYVMSVKSDKAWAPSCRILEVVLTDGANTAAYRLNFRFNR